MHGAWGELLTNFDFGGEQNELHLTWLASIGLSIAEKELWGVTILSDYLPELSSMNCKSIIESFSSQHSWHSSL